MRNGDHPQFTDHCFTGEYPTKLTDHAADRAVKDFQLSLLSEAAE
jgi:amidophosphoribosyltransferase